MKIIEARTQGNYNFFPVIDEVLVFSDYAARARKGKLARLVSTAAISSYHECSRFDICNDSRQWLG